MGKASRDKGKRGEREARKEVQNRWNCPGCVRSAQVSGIYASDLLGGPDGLHLEVKRFRRVVSYDWLLQAQRDAKDNDIPVVLARQDGGDWTVTVRMEDSVEFARRLLGHLEQSKKSVS